MQSQDADYEKGTDSLPDGLDRDTVFDVLASERRRRALALVDRHGGMDYQTLAEHLAAIESGSPVGRVPEDAHNRVRVALYQSHLPKLDDAGVLIHDRETGHVSPGPHLEAVAWYLDHGPASTADAVFETVRSWIGRAKAK